MVKGEVLKGYQEMAKLKRDAVFGVKALKDLEIRCVEHEKRKPLVSRGWQVRKFGLGEDQRGYMKYIYDPDDDGPFSGHRHTTGRR
jgi:hypothetical protein